MKIAVVGGPVGARGSCSVGSGRYDIARLSTALAGRGNDVRIYTADGAGEVRSAGPTLTRIPLSRGDVDSTDSLMPFIGEMARHLVDAWSRDQPDVVHCHGVSYGMAAQLAANRWPVPTVQALHGLGATARRRRLGRAPTDAALKLEKLLARNASALTADCTEDLDELMRMGCGRTKLSVLPPGVDIDDTAAADTSGLHTSESLRVVAVARDFSPAQGLSCVLRLLPSLRRPNCFWCRPMTTIPPKSSPSPPNSESPTACGYWQVPARHRWRRCFDLPMWSCVRRPMSRPAAPFWRPWPRGHRWWHVLRAPRATW